MRPAVRHRAALAALFAATACLDPTQATIEITTDIACGGPGHEPATLFDVVVSAGVPGSALGEAVQTISDHCEGGDIGSVVVVPRAGEPRASVLVVGGIGSTNAEACLPFARGEVDQAPECVVARRTVAFVDHTPLRVPVRLFAACAGVRCAEDRTCVPGAPLDETGLPCVSAEVECRGAVCTVGGGGEVGGGGVGGGGVGGGGGGSAETERAARAPRLQASRSSRTAPSRSTRSGASERPRASSRPAGRGALSSTSSSAARSSRWAPARGTSRGASRCTPSRTAPRRT